ncbi:MAG: septum site-determining protein MinC [Burkholderiales bacterium]|jgi:septum site-determining protein MinC
MSKTQTKKPIEIKISTVVAVAAILRESDLAALDTAMKQMTGGTSDYFDNEFAVIDVGSCDFSGPSIDWAALIALFKSYRLNPVAVRNAPDTMEAEIIAHGLSIDVVVKSRQEAEQEPVAPAPAPAAPNPAPAAQQGAVVTIVDTPVRAGQRIYARGGDLIVTAVVNSGAELIADGSIHVYAPLRGRALAGATGNGDARIFALAMEAELVSIAGTYRTFENGIPKDFAGKPAQVRLVGDRLDVLAIQAKI